MTPAGSVALVADVLAGALPVALTRAEGAAGQPSITGIGIGEITALAQAEIPQGDTAAIVRAIAATAGVAVIGAAADVRARLAIRNAAGSRRRVAPACRRGDGGASQQREQPRHLPPGEPTAEPTRQRIEASRFHRTIPSGANGACNDTDQDSQTVDCSRILWAAATQVKP